MTRRAHPRSRGENRVTGVLDVFQMGSSPLTRGKPACDTDVRDRARAHPRSRGENPLGSQTRPTAGGSSPLTRGKRPFKQPQGRVVWLIPAHAGKTAYDQAAVVTRAAHPRSRGENNPVRGDDRLDFRLIPAHAGKTRRCPVKGVRSGGSSPLTRGKRLSRRRRARL